MKKIFTTFSQLVDANKGLFAIVTKSNQLGTYEAVWNARDGEIEQLREKLEELEAQSLKDREKIELLSKENEEYASELETMSVLELQRRELEIEFDKVLGENNSIKKKAQRQTLEFQKIATDNEALRAKTELSVLASLEDEMRVEQALEMIARLENKLGIMDEEKIKLLERIEFHKARECEYRDESKKLALRVKEDHAKLSALDAELCNMEAKEKVYKEELVQAYEKINHIEAYINQFSEVLNPKKVRKNSVEITQ